MYDMDNLERIQKQIKDLKVEQVQAALDLPSLKLGAIKYGNEMKKAKKVLDQCSKVIDSHVQSLQANYNQLQWLLNNAINVEGKSSSEQLIFSPLASGETPPANYELQLVETFK